MKKNKILLILALILVLILLLTNNSESDFLLKLNNSSDPLDEFYMPRLFKNDKAILRSGGKYYSPHFNYEYYNIGIFSFISINSGYIGNLRTDGKSLNQTISFDSKKLYFSILGNYYLIDEDEKKEKFSN